MQDGLRTTAFRSLCALATVEANRPLIIRAGAIEPLIDTLVGTDLESIQVAANLLSALSDTDTVTLEAFNVSAMATLIKFIRDAPEQLQAIAAETVGNLARTASNRRRLHEISALGPLTRLLHPSKPQKARCAAVLSVQQLVRHRVGNVLPLSLSLSLSPPPKIYIYSYTHTTLK